MTVLIPTYAELVNWAVLLVNVGAIVLLAICWLGLVELLAAGIADWWYHLTPKDQQRAILEKARERP